MTDHVLSELPREDLDLIQELVLQSGSLKALAQSYGVSYPTIRSRLDRVIDRLRALLEGKHSDPLNDLLADLVGRGELSVSGARLIQSKATEIREQGVPNHDAGSLVE